MKIALRSAAFALVVALAATAYAGLQGQRTTAAHDHAHGTCTVSDPDPNDCLFCGGNPSLHVRRMADVEQTTMAVLATLLR